MRFASSVIARSLSNGARAVLNSCARLIQAALPQHCMLCSAGTSGRAVCDACYTKLPWLPPVPRTSTTASNRPAATTAPANTVNGRDSNASARSNAVGTTGQVPDTANTDRTARQNRDNLPGTASSLSLVELLSGLSIAGGLTLRGLRRRTAEAR